MANQKLTPRQKMINMMYLVLIAMLALNVSREILKSFHLFELSFINENKNIDDRNNQIMNKFKASMKNERSKIKTEEWYQLAIETREISKSFCDYIDKIKLDIIQNGGGREESIKGKSTPELKRPDDLESHAHYFMKDGKGNGDKLMNRINQVRIQLASKVRKARFGPAIEKSLLESSQLKALDPEPNEAGVQISWSTAYLESAPLAGAVTLLTKIQSDCKAMEAEVLTVLNENININSIINDSQMAMIIPDNQSVMSGDNFNAKVALMSYDSRATSKIVVNGKEVNVVDGVGYVSIPARGTAQNSLTASIESIDPKTGKTIMVESKPITWNSFEASATVSADNMNVLFFGLDNPMSISIPGITPENTVVSGTNGIRLTKQGAGKYIAKVSGNQTTGQVIVKAKMPDGTIKDMGNITYKLRKVPRPKALFGSLSSGTHSKTVLKAQNIMYAYLEDFYFNNVKFKVTHFRASCISKKIANNGDKQITGNALSGIQGLISNASSGDVIYINEIKAEGPSGTVNLDDLTIKIK
jgi:gliding motility-associated protein GldM